MINKTPNPQRFIPTCVGNTAANYCETQIAAVHPHVRGEHHPSETLDVLKHGSSPRAWGTQLKQVPDSRNARFIPTCVGNTKCAILMALPSTVHPHVRGEHLHRMERCTQWAGSSPRAWGTRGLNQARMLSQRFIPTCVGNTP